MAWPGFPGRRYDPSQQTRFRGRRPRPRRDPRGDLPPAGSLNRVTEGFHANNEAFLLEEIATNLPTYRHDTGPTDFHLHLSLGGFQLVLVTSGMFTFDYDGRVYHVSSGSVMLQSAIVHRQLFYAWSGLSTEKNLKAPQTVVPDPISIGYSGKFLEAFITDPTSFPNPTIVGPDYVDETETPRNAWSHPLHNRPADGCFCEWFRMTAPSVTVPRARGAVVGKPPGKEPAGKSRWGGAARYGDLSIARRAGNRRLCATTL